VVSLGRGQVSVKEIEELKVDAVEVVQEVLVVPVPAGLLNGAVVVLP
jgi:hypothetical protein